MNVVMWDEKQESKSQNQVEDDAFYLGPVDILNPGSNLQEGAQSD